ncbi:MAG: hypothetical protein R3F59_21305 [Myxococcota bacterium]
MERARHVAAAHPDDARVLRAAARVLARTGDRAGAHALYDAAVAHFPGDWRTRVARAVDAPPDQRLADWQDAIAHGAPATMLPAAWAAIPEGLVWLDAASEREPAFLEKLAAFLDARGDPDSALLAWEQVHLVDPDRFPPGYAALLLRLDHTDEAAAYLARALAAHPDDPSLRAAAAEVQEARGAWAEAAEAWFALGPERPGAVARGLKALAEAEGPEAALRRADRMHLEGDLDGLAVLEVARLRRRAGDYAGCAAIVESAGLLASKRFGPVARQLVDACTTAAHAGR